MGGVAEPAMLHTGSHTQRLHMKIKCNDTAILDAIPAYFTREQTDS